MDEKNAIYWIHNLAVILIPILLAFNAYMQQQIERRFQRLERRLDQFESKEDEREKERNRREEVAQEKYITILQKLARLESIR